MENDPQKVKKSEHFLNNKNESKKLIMNSENNELVNIETANNRTANVHASQIPSSNTKGITTNSNSPKMGSRRIFTPQFKLQVLESYRNDNDCKGNQRATARKYNIHRRQIQKWLQCESSLRSSVANINHNSVKHQFHNVSVQQQTKNMAITSHSSVNSSSYASSELHSTHLCIEPKRGSTSLNTIKVPSLSYINTTPSTQGTHDTFDAANLATAVAAAAGSIAITSSSSTLTAAVVSPLRPSAIISANRNANPSISPLLPHHYGLPPYSNMASTSTVTMLTHHMSNMHQQTHPSHQTSYQYHNVGYSPTLSHHQTDKTHASYFSPITLPTINVLPASASNSYTRGDTEHTDKLNFIPMRTKAYPKFISDKNTFLCNDNQFLANFESPESVGDMNPANVNIQFTINQLKGDLSYSTAYPFGPMDLSLPHRRELRSDLDANTKSNFPNSEIEETKISLNTKWDEKIDVVDLTYRKRKILNMSQSTDNYTNKYAEKHQKLSNPDVEADKPTNYKTNENYVNHMTVNSPYSTEEDDIEIEVGIEEKFPPSSKTVKLFKPYLLDECENKNHCIESSRNNFSKNEQCEKLEKNSTIYLSNSSTKSSNDVFVRDNTFPNVVKDNYNSCVDSSNFLVEYRSESPRNACSPATSVPTMSPTNFQYPKGSPSSSGYESSTSTYSDSSLSSKNETYAYGQTYSVNLQMQSIYNENINILNPTKHVQRWLEKDDSKPLTTNSSIALLI